MNGELYNFWYSRLASLRYLDCDDFEDTWGLGKRLGHKNFVTLMVSGEPIEAEYTEMSRADSDYRPHWKDVVLLGQAKNADIRFEYYERAKR